MELARVPHWDLDKPGGRRISGLTRGVVPADGMTWTRTIVAASREIRALPGGDGSRDIAKA